MSHRLPLGATWALGKRRFSSSCCLAALIIAVALVFTPIRPSSGAISVSGDTSITPANPNGQARIGDQSFGTLTIDGGSIFSSGFTQIGINPPGVGFATVTDPGSQWNVTSSSMEVGLSGLGRLNILNGGLVNMLQSGLLRIAASSPSGHGTVLVDGANSLLQIGGQLLVGTSGSSATLQIANGAIVNAPFAQTEIGSRGRIEFSDGLLRTNVFDNDGLVIGSGQVAIQSTSNIMSRGRIEARAGDLLRFTGPAEVFTNLGIIAADGGEIEFSQVVESGETGAQITLRNALVRVGTNEFDTAQLNNSGLLAAIGGLNDFHGRIFNSLNGRIAVTNQSVMVFHDDVTIYDGQLTVFPGASAVFLEDLVVDPQGVLLADLAGTGDDTGFGQIEVVGNAALAGSLAVTLAEGYEPQLGDSFPLLTAGGISGSLSLGEMPILPQGLVWDLNIDAHRAVLSVAPAPSGDYNNNGVVDAADYVLWRKTENQSGANLPADGDNSGTVDAGDYDVWHAQFGSTADGGAAGTAAVPEPATTTLICLMLLGLFAQRRQ